MSSEKSFFQSSIGKKVLMAISGILLYGFVVAHMTGHLLMFQGQDKYNAYAKFLQDLGGLLWVARIGLLVIVIVHILTAVKLTLENQAARPVKYFNQQTNKASYASLTMKYSGLIVLAFIIYHLLHFTFKATHPEFSGMMDTLGRHDVYNMMVVSFTNPLLAIAYILSIGLLCIHLSHGFFSFFQTLGLNSPKIEPKLKLVSNAVGLGIFLGFASVPTAILLKIIS